MERKMRLELRQYYKSIGSALICDSKKKKQILDAIKSSVECYLSDNPQSDMNDVISHFGTANEVAAEYCSNESPDAIIAKVNQRKRILRLLFIIAALALLIYIIVIVTALIADMRASAGYSTFAVEDESLGIITEGVIML